MKNSNWTIESGEFGPRMVMHTAWSNEALVAAKENQIKELELNHAKGWRRTELLFLRDLEDRLRSFSILDFNIDDISPVNCLSQLRVLRINTYCNTRIDFNLFPHLRYCYLEWRAKASSVFEHAGIEKLFINKYPKRDFDAFSAMSGLRELSLTSSKLETCAGIEYLAKLSFLGIYFARKLRTIDGIQNLKMLTKLEINNCPSLHDISLVGELLKLEHLALCTNQKIDTIKSLRNLKNLETFLFYESTNIEDGDLSPLEELPNLKTVAFQERSHYTHTRNDFRLG